MARDPGTYALVLALPVESRLQVGKLGTCLFPAGYYLYLGSALGGLAGRLGRHLRRDKKPRWHIDYLLPHCNLVEVWHVMSEERLECLWRQAAQAMPGARILAPGFGSSDCRCPSHLIYLPTPPAFDLFRSNSGNEALRQMGA